MPSMTGYDDSDPLFDPEEWHADQSRLHAAAASGIAEDRVRSDCQRRQPGIVDAATALLRMGEDNPDATLADAILLLKQKLDEVERGSSR